MKLLIDVKPAPHWQGLENPTRKQFAREIKTILERGGEVIVGNIEIMQEDDVHKRLSDAHW